jgi:hypothetical protein
MIGSSARTGQTTDTSHTGGSPVVVRKTTEERRSLTGLGMTLRNLLPRTQRSPALQKAKEHRQQWAKAYESKDSYD